MLSYCTHETEDAAEKATATAIETVKVIATAKAGATENATAAATEAVKVFAAAKASATAIETATADAIATERQQLQSHLRSRALSQSLSRRLFCVALNVPQYE